MSEHKYEIREVDIFDSRADKLEKYARYYLRGAIQLDELLYNITQLEENNTLEDVVNVMMEAIEWNTFEDRAITRKEVIKIIKRRG